MSTVSSASLFNCKVSTTYYYIGTAYSHRLRGSLPSPHPTLFNTPLSNMQQSFTKRHRVVRYPAKFDTAAGVASLIYSDLVAAGGGAGF